MRGAGAGDGDDLATLLLSLTQALDAHAAVSEVVTFTRAFEDPSLPGVYSRSQEPVGQGSRIERLRFGPRGYLATAEQWAYREDIEAALTRSIARHGPFDVAGLRFADIGPFAAAGLPQARRAVVFTLAPDPHAVLRESEAAGQLDRETFPAADLEHHYVFRAWLVERMLREADALAVLPRPEWQAGVARTPRPLVDAVRPDRVWTVPEGLAVDSAAGPPVTQAGPAIRSLCMAVGSLPERRLGLPLLLTVARLNRVKRHPAARRGLGGRSGTTRRLQPRGRRRRLDNPPPEERAVLSEIDAVGARLPGACQGLVLLGHRPHADVPQILRAAVHGIPGVVGAGGVYACPSRKEEFGLALLEALAAGLSVVGPDRGGPATYVEDGHSGFLADTTVLESLRRGLAEPPPPGSTRPAPRAPRAGARGFHRRCDGRPARVALRTRDGRSRGLRRMTALLVSPDYVSHYCRSRQSATALRDGRHEVVFATGDGLRERVLADGFLHVELRLGAGSNPAPEASGDDPGLDEFLAATREGMVSTLELQARRRLHDLLWEPRRVTERLAEIVDDLRPALVLSDQLAFGAALAFGRSTSPSRRSCPAIRASCRRPECRSATPSTGRPDSRKGRSSRR